MQNLIFCHKCRKNFIPAPEGANEKTQYVCRECSPVALAEDCEFDRCQFDRVGHVPSLSKKDLLSLFAANEDNITLTPSTLILAARKAGHGWVKNATPTNLARLQPAVKRSFILHYWCGLKSREIGELLGIRADQVKKSISESKTILASLKPPFSPIYNRDEISTRAYARRDRAEQAISG